MYNTTTSIFAGMSTAQLQAALSAAQQAYLDLSSGVKVVTASYTQGDGAKSVTYTQTDLPRVVALIKQLQAQLGIVTRPRRPIRFIYR
ncbi:MAG: gpW family head-tail joining protein [Betaproteobacteria bacterium]|nr:gpW family head-tail joining protein [Betaproteobacteria bacterium]